MSVGLDNLSSVISAINGFISAVLLYYFSRHFPWRASQKNVLNLVNRTDVFKKLRKQAQEELGLNSFRIGFWAGVFIPVVMSIGMVKIGGANETSLLSKKFVGMLLLSSYLIWVVFMVIYWLVYKFRAKWIYPILRIYRGVSVIFIGSFAVMYFSKVENMLKGMWGFLGVYLLVLGVVFMFVYLSTSKEEELIIKNWKKLSTNERTILVRVYTKSGREIVGIIHDIFQKAWFQVENLESGNITNIDWREIEAIEILS